MSESGFRLAEMLQIKPPALILSMLRLTVLAVVSLRLESPGTLEHVSSNVLAPGQAHTATEFTSFCTSKLKWYGRTTTKKGGSKKQGKGKKKKHPEIPREANLNGIRPKMVQKNTKDMLTFRINSFNTLIFFSQKNLFFFL